MPIWQWPNLLSLDAPLVAVAWQALLAQTTGLPLRPVARVVLGLSVWVIYIADRLLDVRKHAPDTARHRFYRAHWRLACVVLVVLVIADLALAGIGLRRSVLREGLPVSLAVAGYLAALHGPGERWLRPPKEVAVALLFTAGTFVVAITNASGQEVRLLGLPALAFFGICLTNLIGIERWEAGELPASAVQPPATRALCCSYWWWSGFWCVGCWLLALWTGSAWYWACAASSTAMLVLMAAGPRLSLEARRCWIDFALLTPLAFLR